MEFVGRVRRARVPRRAIVAVLCLATASIAVPIGTAGAATEATCPDSSGTVKVGMSYFGSVGAAIEGIGAEDAGSIVPADQAIIDGYNRGIDALNDAGGVNGCQVEGVFFNFRSPAPDYNQESQQECAAFTQDTKVVAVYTVAFETKVAIDCYAKAKVPVFALGTNYPPSCADQKAYPGLVYTPGSVYTCRFDSFIKLWDDAGLFPKDANVGIVTMDDGSGQGPKLADKVWTPQLKKMKIPVTSFKYKGSINSAAFSQVNAALGNAVLQFKAAGVNVVLFTPAGGQGTAAFMPQATTQSFFPNYGVDTSDGLIVAAALGGNGIKKGIAVSWAIIDLPLQEQQELPANPAIEECAEWSAPSTFTLTGSAGSCDFFNILKAGFEGAKKMDAPSLYKGISALGTSFISSTTYDGATKFAKGRTDGASKAMMLEFDTTTKTWLPIDGELVNLP
jgi:ABC-type branched-subunit amino acid transport system substrate-binding protein